MIQSNIDESVEKAKNYTIADSKNCTKEQLRHLFGAENWAYTLAYGLLEDIQQAIRTGKCTDVKEVEQFISDNIDKTVVYTRIDVCLKDCE